MSGEPTPETSVPEEAAAQKPSRAKAAKPAAPESDGAEATPKAAGKKAAKAKEEKPFEQEITEDVIPAAVAAFQKRGVEDLQLRLEGKTLLGSFAGGKKQFSVLFAEGSLNGRKFFRCATEGSPASTIESFMIDERRVDVNLLVFYLVQRLYAQQWY
ncbi:DUF2996 domain-containing protein [Synechococcus sp. Nb3U1]|uniref:DUF2996 domain-containing protein n=1 Tax=Synechococcus sp. Nb3U1 TaxID=1914529 RepID=UPI001F2F93F7|nr:DUF2996 domain-containing protein [Synechococcus sp. Nb3U1]MCF2970016.1 DUF2996 domain-containing protein [Synechococcus sp. Nb3U1]